MAVVGRRLVALKEAFAHGRFDALARRRVPRAAVDLLLAPLLAAAALTEVVDRAPGGGSGADAVGTALALMVGVPFAVHRRWPTPVLVVVAASAALLQARHSVPAPVTGAGATIGTVLLGVGVAVFLTTVRLPHCPSYRLLAAMVVVAGATEALIGHGEAIGSAVVVDVLVVAAWALGCLVRARRAMAAEAVEHAAALEREQVALARTAVVEERSRIARELHDIVAHHVSLMVVQAIAADRVQSSDPDKTRELHAAIEATGRATVAELRRLLELLRTDDDEAMEGRAPQPVLADLPRLLDALREAGLRVRATSTGAARRLAAGTELTAYRVVQEALTNTLKHAGHTRAVVALDWQPDHLAVSVRDDGPLTGAAPHAAPHAVPPGGGHGLVGMHERVTAAGGTLDTGPLPQGGFLVSARLPLDPPCDNETDCPR
ncbi:sensor histidine kinase [Streptomyces sp. NPDC004065]|uniref:sensor histidine kinase n=1 Tax=Streptomyces sp. NPDC004065 TaxID=3364689 RepID=UPI00384E8416